MIKRTVSKTKVKKERSPTKIKKVLEKKGYKDGKAPNGKVLHHTKSVAKGGKTTSKNTRVISKAKHKEIHKNRRKKGNI